MILICELVIEGINLYKISLIVLSAYLGMSFLYILIQMRTIWQRLNVITICFQQMMVEGIGNENHKKI